MRANINENGVLEISPETPIECYALKQWSGDNIIFNPVQGEDCVIRGSNFLVSTRLIMQPSKPQPEPKA